MSIYDDIATLQAQVAELQTQMLGQALTENTDLNNLSIGRYYIPSITVSATILNKPIERSSNAFIDVLPGATGEIQQWYFINSKGADINNKVYYRYYYDNAWSAWFTGYLRAEDSGWLSLPLASGISEHNATSFPCRYRKIGNMVYIQGCVKGLATIEGALATIPEGYRPCKPFYIQGATNGGNTDTFNVQATSGIIERVATTLGTISSTNYHFINMQYLTD